MSAKEKVSMLIKGGRVIDPSQDVDGIFDIYIKNGKILDICKETDEYDVTEAVVLDAKDKVVMPGFVDLHVHLREPGYEYKETVETGCKAALRGGVTAMCPMPNTNPVIDTADKVKDLLSRAEGKKVHILPIGAVTKAQEGKELADIRGMKDAGIVAVSEDGKSVMDTLLFRKALREAARLNIPMFSHCEDKPLVDGGVMNAGKKAEELGLPGITNAVEDVIVARDIFMAKETGCRLHLCHCSTADSVAMMELAKKQGLDVTAEVCPHHFTLCDEDIKADHGKYKMNPPLRSREDVEELKRALAENIMTVISTDHAPHGVEEKDASMLKAPFGIVGLETSFALGYTELVKKGILTLGGLVEKMSTNPAKVLGLEYGTLRKGSPADIVIADIKNEYTIEAAGFASKGKNTPFDGKKVYGKVENTIIGGEIVYSLV